MTYCLPQICILKDGYLTFAVLFLENQSLYNILDCGMSVMIKERQKARKWFNLLLARYVRGTWYWQYCGRRKTSLRGCIIICLALLGGRSHSLVCSAALQHWSGANILWQTVKQVQEQDLLLISSGSDGTADLCMSVSVCETVCCCVFFRPSFWHRVKLGVTGLQFHSGLTSTQLWCYLI